jgi:RNA polymerase sigma-70 factor (ECF subfamily)
LVDLTRHHLGSKMRDAGREISLYCGASPQASSVSLAAQLLGRFTSPSRAAIRAETQLQVQGALNSMDPTDREVLALRHFELLSNGEVAQILGLSKAAASNRYIRALKRLKEILSAVPGRGRRRSDTR